MGWRERARACLQVERYASHFTSPPAAGELLHTGGVASECSGTFKRHGHDMRANHQLPRQRAHEGLFLLALVPKPMVKMHHVNAQLLPGIAAPQVANFDEDMQKSDRVRAAADTDNEMSVTAHPAVLLEGASHFVS